MILRGFPGEMQFVAVPEFLRLFQHHTRDIQHQFSTTSHFWLSLLPFGELHYLLSVEHFLGCIIAREFTLAVDKFPLATALRFEGHLT